MPTKRLRASRNFVPEISAEELYFVSDALFGREAEKRSLKLFVLQGDDKAVCALWTAHREAILAAWVEAHPGTRPSWWWRFDAPRISDESISQLGRRASVVQLHSGDFCEPRKRLGGIGDPRHEVLNYWPSFPLGIPDNWTSQDDVDMYNGRQKTIHGEPITCNGKWFEGNFEGLPPDPNDPPKFESQAAYLKRHGLLEPGEERRLNPADFEPEIITVETEEEESVAESWPAERTNTIH